MVERIGIPQHEIYDMTYGQVVLAALKYSNWLTNKRELYAVLESISNTDLQEVLDLYLRAKEQGSVA